MRSSLAMALILATGAAHAGEPGPGRSSLETFAAGLETLHANFTQTITSQDGRIESEGAGEVWLARPARFRWAYGGEFPELIVADGQRIWLYDELLEQVTVRQQSALVDDSPLLLLTDLATLDERFTVTEVGEYEDMHLLELVSNSQDSEFERVLLGLAGDGIRIMAMEDAFGLRTEIRFFGVERNPALDAGLFAFEPPENADVVGTSGLAPEP